MQWNNHSNLLGKHAILSPSQHGWVNDTEEDLCNRYIKKNATEAGTILHNLADELIKDRTKLNRNDTKLVLFELVRNKIPRFAIDMDYIYPNFMSYVNDAVKYQLDSEVPLYYSENCFGTADAINYKDGFLRIHDLKTGTTPASMEQLITYASLFCLEYQYKPKDIQCELRIYQNNEIIVHEPTLEEIVERMDKIVTSDNCLKRIKGEIM